MTTRTTTRTTTTDNTNKNKNEKEDQKQQQQRRQRRCSSQHVMSASSDENPPLSFPPPTPTGIAGVRSSTIKGLNHQESRVQHNSTVLNFNNFQQISTDSSNSYSNWLSDSVRGLQPRFSCWLQRQKCGGCSGRVWAAACIGSSA